MDKMRTYSQINQPHAAAAEGDDEFDSRLQKRREKRGKRNQKKSSSSSSSSSGQGMPVRMKIILIPFLLFISLLGGLIAGYSIVGDGSIPQVFNLQTWKHIYDLVFAK